MDETDIDINTIMTFTYYPDGVEAEIPVINEIIDLKRCEKDFLRCMARQQTSAYSNLSYFKIDPHNQKYKA